MKTHTLKMDDGSKKKFFLVPVARETAPYANCTGCHFDSVDGNGCQYPADNNGSSKCIGTSHADCQDRIYKEQL